MMEKERQLRVKLGQRMANNLVKLLSTLDNASQKLVEFINSGMWATEDYINVHERPFTALSSLAQAEIRAIKELRELVESGILDEETIRTISQETETLQNKALEDDKLKSIIEELKLSIQKAAGDLKGFENTGKEEKDAT